MALTELDGYIFGNAGNVSTLIGSKIVIDLEKVIAYQRYIRTDVVSRDRQITQVYIDGNDNVHYVAMSPTTFGKLLPVGPGVNPAQVKVSSADTTADYLENKLTAGSGITLTKLNPGADEEIEIAGFDTSIYTDNGTIGSGRVATLTDTLTWTDGQEIRIVNSRIFKEVTQASDLPATLVTNTTYIIRGEITISSNITCSVEGVEIIGIDRNQDHLIWSGTGALLTITDVNLGLNNLRFSSTQAGNSILIANNIAASGYNNGRLKVLTIFNCQFRGTYDVMDINGYDLVDINNSLFFYIKATNFGLRFRDTSKIEITSCELIRWFDESTIPTPSGYATVSMVELQNNNLASFGAMNINGCIIHPQQTQNGIDIGTGSTTGFGTIAANAFINLGLTTGKVFLPETSSLPDYSQTATLRYDIFSNQGLPNSTSYSMGYFNGLISGSNPGTPTLLDVGTGFVTAANQRFTSSNTGIVTYNGTKNIEVIITASISIEGNGNNMDAEFSIYKSNILIAGSNQITTTRQDTEGGNIPLLFLTNLVSGDTIEIRAELLGGNSWDLTSYHLAIKE